ncbi:MAG: glucodextranase DOMON-like domain-containing protein, partial [Anaerolineales bacterium]
YVVDAKSGTKVAVFFRDWTLSDKIGFTYSGLPGDKAAQDLINRLENIRKRLKEEGAQGPHIVSIILDGENAWEYYDNDGKLFLNTLYHLLAESQTIKTVTPSEYLAMFPEQRTLEHLFPGAWFSPNYDTWIGEAEEKQAWNYLGRARYDLSKYDISKTRQTTPEKLAQALDYMYLAEGSDWFWWYGSDQDSGQDEYFDQGFRALLAKMYESLGEPVPAYVNIPIIPKKPARAEQEIKGLSTPTIDGQSAPGEWDNAALFTSGAQAAGMSLAYTFDRSALYVRLSYSQPLAADSRIGIYIASPRAQQVVAVSHSEQNPLPLGLAATHLFEWDGKQLLAYQAGKDTWAGSNPVGHAAQGSEIFEAAIPWETLGDLEAGDDLRLVVLIEPAGNILPLQGPAQIVLPDLGTSTVLLEINDPEHYDHGPGSYTYPTDSVFKPQVFDLKTFSVAYDDKNLIFKFTF